MLGSPVLAGTRYAHPSELLCEGKSSSPPNGRLPRGLRRFRWLTACWHRPAPGHPLPSLKADRARMVHAWQPF